MASLEEIREHWERWARNHGTSLRATTRASTAKQLEIDALSRHLSRIGRRTGRPLRILEAGCGNGFNCVALARQFPDWTFVGFDYVPAMLDSARQLQRSAGISDERLLFLEDNILSMKNVLGLFDVVVTVRCLINLNSISLQKQAILSLFNLLSNSGGFLFIENSKKTHDLQNSAREMLGLARRSVAEFNLFLDDEEIMRCFSELKLEVEIENFTSLHDIILYVLAPYVNNGTLDYENPMVEAAAKLSIELNKIQPQHFGEFGQNRLYRCFRS